MERNLYACERCGRKVRIRSHGLCQACRSKELQLNKKTDLHPVRIKKKKLGNLDLSRFFHIMLEELMETRVSMTGTPIHFPTVCNVCHILPKRKYKSVAMLRDNIIFLQESEHTLFDMYLDRMEFDRLEKEFPFVWKYAVKKIIEMEHDGLIKERGKLIIEILERYGNKR